MKYFGIFVVFALLAICYGQVAMPVGNEMEAGGGMRAAAMMNLANKAGGGARKAIPGALPLVGGMLGE